MLGPDCARSHNIYSEFTRTSLQRYLPSSYRLPSFCLLYVSSIIIIIIIIQENEHQHFGIRLRKNEPLGHLVRMKKTYLEELCNRNKRKIEMYSWKQ